MATTHPYNDVLKSIGFVASRDSVAFTYEPLSMIAEALAFLSDPHTPIHFMRGDSDWILATPTALSDQVLTGLTRLM